MEDWERRGSFFIYLEDAYTSRYHFIHQSGRFMAIVQVLVRRENGIYITRFDIIKICAQSIQDYRECINEFVNNLYIFCNSVIETDRNNKKQYLISLTIDTNNDFFEELIKLLSKSFASEVIAELQNNNYSEILPMEEEEKFIIKL